MKRVSLIVMGALAMSLAVPAFAGDDVDVRQRRADLLGSHRHVTAQVPTPVGEGALAANLPGLTQRLGRIGVNGGPAGQSPVEGGVVLSLAAPVQKLDNERVADPGLVAIAAPVMGIDDLPAAVRAEILRRKEASGALMLAYDVHQK